MRQTGDRYFMITRYPSEIPPPILRCCSATHNDTLQPVSSAVGIVHCSYDPLRWVLWNDVLDFPASIHEGDQRIEWLIADVWCVTVWILSRFVEVDDI